MRDCTFALSTSLYKEIKRKTADCFYTEKLSRRMHRKRRRVNNEGDDDAPAVSLKDMISAILDCSPTEFAAELSKDKVEVRHQKRVFMNET